MKKTYYRFSRRSGEESQKMREREKEEDIIREAKSMVLGIIEDGIPNEA